MHSGTLPGHFWCCSCDKLDHVVESKHLFTNKERHLKLAWMSNVIMARGTKAGSLIVEETVLVIARLLISYI